MKVYIVSLDGEVLQVCSSKEIAYSLIDQFPGDGLEIDSFLVDQPNWELYHSVSKFTAIEAHGR